MNDKLPQLTTLSQLRESERDEKRIALTKATSEIRALNDLLKSLSKSITDANLEIRNANHKTPSQISERQQFNSFRLAKEAEIVTFEEKIIEARTSLRKAKKTLEEKRAELIEAEAALKAVTMTIDAEELRIKKNRKKKAEDDADDITQSKWKS